MKWQGLIISIKPVGWAYKSVVAQKQVEMELISHNSTGNIARSGTVRYYTEVGTLQFSVVSGDWNVTC